MEHRNRESGSYNIQASVDELNSTGLSGEEGRKDNGYYSLPTRRYTTMVQFLLFLDLTSSVTLWLCGGNNDYMEKNVEHFKIRDSVFDLAAMAFLRCGILFFVYPWLESLTLKQIDKPYNRELASKKCFCHSVAIFLSVGSLAYSVTKGVLIYEVRSEKGHKLHPTYYALAISSVAFTFLEALCALGSFIAMRKLKVQRILHVPNDAETKKKKKVNLRRLMTVAKPVSSCFVYLIGCYL